MKIVAVNILCLIIGMNLSLGQKVVNREFDYSNYNKVRLECPIDLEIVADEKEGLSVKCDERLIKAFVIKNINNELIINFNPKVLKSKIFSRANYQFGENKTKINGITYQGTIKMVVHVKYITEITSSQSGDITWKGNLPTKDLSLKANSSGDITWEGVLITNMLTAKASSSGDIEGDCKSKSVIINLDSSGDYLGNLDARTLKMSLSSSGDFKGNINAQTADFFLSSSSDASVSGSIGTLNIKASSSADFHGKSILYKKAIVETHSSANIYLSKYGEVIDNTHKHTGVIIE